MGLTIETLYKCRIDYLAKDDRSGDRIDKNADKIMLKYPAGTITSFSGNPCCYPYFEIIDENRAQVQKAAEQLTNVILKAKGTIY